jgi:hypothetical protein
MRTGIDTLEHDIPVNVGGRAREFCVSYRVEWEADEDSLITTAVWPPVAIEEYRGRDMRAVSVDALPVEVSAALRLMMAEHARHHTPECFDFDDDHDRAYDTWREEAR